MEVNPTIMVALITAITAIIAPLINSYINNKNQIKLKNLDLFYKEKSDTYQRFCTAAIDLDYWIYSICDDITPPSHYYLKAHQLAYLIADKKTRSLLNELHPYYFLGEIKESEITTLLSKIVESMNEDLEKYHKHI